MVMVSAKKVWFKAKKYGWGWTPATWEGWVLVGLYAGLCVLAGIYLLPHSDEELGVVYLTAFWLFIISLTSFLIGISYLKGETPVWRWGSKPKVKQAKKDDSKRDRLEK